MRKIIACEFMTLDGVIQNEDEGDGFKHGGWFFGYADEATGAVIQERLARPVDLLLGRKTFAAWETYWPTHSGFWPNVMTATKYVASNTRDSSDWQPTVFLSGDLAEKVRQLKQTDGPDLHVMGSADMLQTLFKNDLVDGLELMIFPITLGPGKRLFAGGTIPAAFKVTDSQVTPNGIISVNYERAGDVKTGAPQIEEDWQKELSRSMRNDDEQSKTAIVRQGFEKACREYTDRVNPYGFARTKKNLWTRIHSHWVDFVHFHRHGISYGAPATFSVDIRVHWGVRVLNDSFSGLHLNGPESDPNRLRTGRYHLRFNARSGSTYDRCIEDLTRFFVEQCEPWFNRFASVEDLLNRIDSPLNETEKRFLADAANGNLTDANLAISLKELCIKSG